MNKNIVRKGYAAALLFLLCTAVLQFQVIGDTSEPLQTRETIYVDDDAECPGHGTLYAPYCSIQYAIDNVDDGDDIKIASGEYFEDILIGKEITLDWHGSDINGSDTGIPIINGEGIGIVILIRSSDVVIEQCSIINSGSTDLDAGIYVGEESSDVTILNNEITNCYYGVWIKRYSALETNHEIRGNIIDNIEQEGILISLSDSNSVYNNVVTNCGSHGIQLLDCNENRVKEHILQDKRFGVVVDVGMQNEVELNLCENNTEYGLVVVNTQKTVITNNDFINNGAGGATWINCLGDRWFHNYWGSIRFFFHIVWGSLRGADMSLPWFKIEINPASSPNVP